MRSEPELDDILGNKLYDALASLNPSLVARLGGRTVQVLTQLLSAPCRIVTEALMGPEKSAEIDRRCSLIIDGLLHISEKQESETELKTLRDEMESLVSALGFSAHRISDGAARVADWVARQSVSGLSRDRLIPLSSMCQVCSHSCQ